MSLLVKIDSEIKQAMLSKKEARLRALRAIKSGLLLAKTEKGGDDILSEETEQKLLQKLAKQRRESAEIYQQQNREDLYKAEIEELEVIEEYLPKQLSRQELKDELQKLIKELNVASIKDMGKLMGAASKQFAGKADGKAINELVKELLST